MEARDVHPNTVARLADSVVAKLKLTGDTFTINTCRTCGYRRGFIAHKERGLYYDSGCNCTQSPPQIRPLHVSFLRKYLKELKYLIKALNYLNRPYHDFAERSVATRKHEWNFIKLRGEYV